MRHITAFVLGFAVLAHATLARAEDGTLQQVGYGAVGVLGTMIYLPLKTGLCILGGLSSGPVVLYDRQTAAAMVGTTCGGTWVITPAIVKGRDPFQVVGDAS